MNTEIINVQEAQNLHKRIMSNQSIMAHALVSLCRDLKIMRDQKLYQSLGYDSFETYAEELAHIKQRQAYAYISTYEKLGSKFIEENESLGITKLELVAQVGAINLPELEKKVNLESVTVRELKDEIKRLQDRGQQLSLNIETLENDNEELTNHIDDVKKQYSQEIDNLKSENKQLREKADSVSVDIEKEIKKAVKDEKQKLKNLQKSYDNKIEKIEKESKEKEEQAKTKIESLSLNIANLSKTLQKTKKESNVSEDLLMLKLIFNNLQSTANKLLDIFEKVKRSDRATADKLSAAIKNYLIDVSEKL